MNALSIFVELCYFEFGLKYTHFFWNVKNLFLVEEEERERRKERERERERERDDILIEGVIKY